jgi:uncharacterized protein (TIGR02001 family)
MTRVLFAASVLASLMPSIAVADDPSWAFNVGAVSDYRYRGISQTRLQPALQGGVDLGLGPFYVGTWASTIKWIKDAGGSADVELDLYGGYKGEITKDLTYDVGVLGYLYPGHDLAVSPNTTEVYGALTFGPVTAKYSHSVSNLFGFADSKGSGYIDLSGSFEITDGWMIAPHVGHQTVENTGAASYTDASLTLSKDFKGLVVSLGVVDARTGAYFGAGKDLGKRGAVLGVKYNF